MYCSLGDCRVDPAVTAVSNDGPFTQFFYNVNPDGKRNVRTEDRSRELLLVKPQILFTEAGYVDL